MYKYDLESLKSGAEVRRCLNYKCDTHEDSKILNTLEDYFDIINDLLRPVVENAKYDGIAFSACEVRDTCLEYLRMLHGYFDDFS
jgi:hypothetical protein